MPAPVTIPLGVVTVMLNVPMLDGFVHLAGVPERGSAGIQAASLTTVTGMFMKVAEPALAGQSYAAPVTGLLVRQPIVSGTI